MYLIFMDGSGNTGDDLTHPTLTVHYVLGLAIPGHVARALEDAATGVLERRFGAACRAPGFECKGSDMYRGEGPCAAMRPADRLALYEELVGLIPAHGADVIWHGIDKPRLARRYAHPMHPHKLAFLFLAEDAQRLLQARNDFGLLVSDEEKSVEQQVIEDLPRYKQLGTDFGYKPVDLTRIVDNVHWVRSHPTTAVCCSWRTSARTCARETSGTRAGKPHRRLRFSACGRSSRRGCGGEESGPRMHVRSRVLSHGASLVRCPLPAAPERVPKNYAPSRRMSSRDIRFFDGRSSLQ